MASYCLANASSATPCPAGTYRNLLGGGASIQCAPCPLGQFCTVGSVLGTNCSASTYANASGASACLPCPLGTLNPTNASGRSAVCPPCPAGGFCPSPTLFTQCPTNTNSTGGASNTLACTCLPGFVCGYYKTVSVTFSIVNVSISDFNSDVNGVQTRFIASVATAAGVSVASVSIVSVGAYSPNAASRRLLRMEQRLSPAARTTSPAAKAATTLLSVVVRINPPSAPRVDALRARADYDGHHIVR